MTEGAPPPMTRSIQLQEFLPATFAERGVAVPFTTPALISARVRQSERKQIEYILANPGGGPGYYVMGWSAVEALCRVTMHDRLLSGVITALTALTPRAIRRSARAVAATGAAGRAAARATQEAERREGDLALVANFEFLKRLVAQIGHADIDWQHLGTATREIRGQVRNSLAQLGPELDAGTDTILIWIEQLANEIAPVGFGATDRTCRAQAIVSDLGRLCETLKLFAESEGGETAYAALVIADEARKTIEAAPRLLAPCHAELEDPLALIRRWARSPARVVEIFSRPDWLFDGWPAIAAIWEATPAERGAQREAICEMERMLPITPRSLAEWLKLPPSSEVDPHRRRWMKANVDWRSGTHVLDRTARNEWLRACTA